MTKLLSFLVFISAFVWTWFLFKPTTEMDTSVHAGIQSKLVELIEQSIKNARPLSHDFKVLQIYTEKITEHQVSAHFAYKYIDQIEGNEQVEQQLSGVAIISQALSEDPSRDKWVIQSVKTSNPKIEFQEGVYIVPDEDINKKDVEKSSEKATQ